MDELSDTDRAIGESVPAESERAAEREVPRKKRDLTSMSEALDTVGVLGLILDQQGRVCSFNGACQRTTGYSLNDVQNRHIWDVLLVPEEVEPVKASFDKLRAGQFPIEYESHWLTRDGRRRLIAWSNSALYDTEGALEYVIATGMDITERRRAEEALRSSEERYRRLVDSSPDAILVHYRGKIVFINNAGATLLGASQLGQVIGKPVMDFVHPEHRAIVKERLQKIIEQGTELPLVENKLVRLDGTVVHLDANSIFPLMYEDKPAVQVVAREISDDDPTREALREADDRYRRLFDGNVAGIYRATLDGRLMDCNERFAWTLGYGSVEEVLSLRVPELYFDPGGWEEFASRLQEQGALSNVELRLRHKDGNPLWILESAQLIKGKGGAPTLVQGTFVEISRRKRAEEALWHSEQLYKTLASICTDAVTATDLRGRIAEVSQRVLDLHGFERAEELIGRSAFELIAPEDHEKAIANLQTALKNGAVRNIEYNLLRKDGTRFVGVLDIALIRDAQGKPQSFVCTTRDLTDRDLVQKGLPVAATEFRDGGAQAEAVLEACRVVAKSAEFGGAARAVFESCKTLIGATAGYVALSTADGREDRVLFSESVGIGDAADLALCMPVRRLRGEAHRTSKTVYQNEVSKEERPAGRTTVGNVLVAPLVAEGKVAGFLTLADKPGGFSENDARLASVFAELGALALHGARTREALRISDERFRSVADTADEAIITFDSREHIVFWNRGAETTFGYSAEEIVGKRLTLLAAEGLREAYQKVMDEVASTGRFTIVAEAVRMAGRRKGGGEFPLELSLATWRTREGLFFTCIIRDITERKLAEEAMRQLADHDAVTGLPNRLLFKDRLTLALANADRNQQRLAVMMLDLDNFKDINHTLGHSVGDQLLKAVGDRLATLLRSGDTVARFGGDEFILLLPGICTADDTAKIAQKVLEALREPFALSGHELHLTASIGVAVYPDDGEDVDTLTRNADLAMHGAKEQGRDTYQRCSPGTKARGPTGLVLVT